jgi:hypothetical protein
MVERRRRLIELVREHPDWDQQMLADTLKVNKSTVSRDLRIINEEFKIVNSEHWLLHRDRVLKEIKEQKEECLRRLRGCTKPHQGARWQEEWTKLMQNEAKILGINSPSHIMVKEIGEDGKIAIPAILDSETENDGP